MTPPMPSCSGPKNTPVTVPVSPLARREGVAPHFDAVAEIAVPPHRPRADGAGRDALGPVFQSGEIQVAVEGFKVDGEVGDPGDSLRRGGEPE